MLRPGTIIQRPPSNCRPFLFLPWHTPDTIADNGTVNYEPSPQLSKGKKNALFVATLPSPHEVRQCRIASRADDRSTSIEYLSKKITRKLSPILPSFSVKVRALVNCWAWNTVLLISKSVKCVSTNKREDVDVVHQPKLTCVGPWLFRLGLSLLSATCPLNLSTGMSSWITWGQNVYMLIFLTRLGMPCLMIQNSDAITISANEDRILADIVEPLNCSQWA